MDESPITEALGVNRLPNERVYLQTEFANECMQSEQRERLQEQEKISVKAHRPDAEGKPTG